MSLEVLSIFDIEGEVEQKEDSHERVIAMDYITQRQLQATERPALLK
jgi:hypothetical protein